MKKTRKIIGCTEETKEKTNENDDTSEEVKNED